MANKNPFATALGATGGQKTSRSFTEALSSTSGITNSDVTQFNQSFDQNQFSDSNPFDQFGTNTNQTGFNPDAFKAQEEALKKKEYDIKRLELHKKINPVDAHEVFNAREEATKKKIENIRKELKTLAKEIKKFHKEIDITLMGQATNSGLDGIGDESFYDKLRAFIILLTQRVRSARTWAQQHNRKKSKKAAKRGKGLGKQMSESSGFEQRASMEQFFNSERGDNWGE